MKTIKNTLLAIAIVAMVVPVFEGCKKGENDPAISLRSRKGRLAGEWTLSKYDRKDTWVNSGSTSTNTATFDGTSETSVYVSGSGSTTTTTSKITTSYTFEKDGTMKMVTDRESVSSPISGYNITVKSNATYEGTWDFTGGSGDTKETSQLLIRWTKFNSTTTTTSTYSGSTTTDTDTDSGTFEGSSNNNSELYEIDQLKNKELILKQYSKEVEMDGDSDTSEGTYTLTAK